MNLRGHMNQIIQEANNFFNDVVQSSEFTDGIRAISTVIPPMIAIPITELTDKEKRTIQKILVDNNRPEVIPESKVSEHVEQLTNITKQIKSIAAQSVLLHGERISQAHKILANYREGVFTKWLLATYGNRQTPYSMLRYYELYQSAPQETQSMIEAAPKKCVYALASREIDQDKKLEFIKNNCNKSQGDFLMLIQSTFPTAQTNRRESVKNTSTIKSMDNLLIKLKSGAQYLNQTNKAEIERLIRHLQKLIE